MKLGCPACGAEVDFRSSSTVFAVCPFCQSMLVRHDVNLEAIGKMADLPDDMSPLQVGTSGRFDGKGFSLLGRLKMAWSDGSWNEWYALFDDGSEGWLAEAQGFWMMSVPDTQISAVPAKERLHPGQSLRLGGLTYHLDDIKQATCVGSEGELPFPAPKGRQSTSVDLSGPNARYACLEYSPNEGVSLYLGRYIEFDDLHLSNLRALDGW